MCELVLVRSQKRLGLAYTVSPTLLRRSNTWRLFCLSRSRLVRSRSRTTIPQDIASTIRQIWLQKQEAKLYYNYVFTSLLVTSRYRRNHTPDTNLSFESLLSLSSRTTVTALNCQSSIDDSHCELWSWNKFNRSNKYAKSSLYWR